MVIEETYLRKNRLGIYQFRRRVPDDLRVYLKQTEICKSLKTRRLKEALFRCRICAEEYGRLFYRMRQRMKKTDDLENWAESEECKELVKQFSKASRNNISFDVNMEPHRIQISNVTMDPSKQEVELAMYEKILEKTTEKFKEVASLFQQNNVPTTQQSNIAADQTALPQAAAPATPAANEVRSRKKNEILFTDIIERFQRHMRDIGQWDRVKTGVDYSSTFKLFEKIFGNRLVHEYTEEDAECFLHCLNNIPSRWLSQKYTKDLDYEEVINVKRPKLTKNVIRSHIIRINVLFKYAKKKKFISSNIFEDIHVKKEKLRKRTPFTAEELHYLFDEKNFADFMSEGYPSRYFAPLIAAFTGARRSEIFFLDVDSVYQKYGIWVIDINDLGEDDQLNPNTMKSVKNEGSIRIVPIHQKLIDLGFLEFVEERRKDKIDKRLFTEYNVVNGQAGHGFTMAFGKWIRKTANKLPQEIQDRVFPKYRGMHSFRHLFISETREKEISEAGSRILVGHAIPDEVHNDYGGEISSELREKKFLELNDELQKMAPHTNLCMRGGAGKLPMQW